MASLFNCNLPEDLYYLVDKHVWLKPSGDGPVTVGIDDVAQNLAGTIVSCTPKKAGRTVPKGQSLATNESVRKSPGILNRDPYGDGWLVRVKPTNWDVDKGELVTGAEGLETYRGFLEAQGIQCRPAGG
jgi:glycine cleavage system H protein